MNGSEMNLEELRDHAMDVNTKMQTNVVEMVKNRKNLNDQIQGLTAYLYEVFLMKMRCEKDIKIFLV